MSRYSSHDPYLDPATGVLKNRFGIADEAPRVGGVTVVSPSGHRLEGVTFDEAIAALRALG
jgi:hypothetical protein